MVLAQTVEPCGQRYSFEGLGISVQAPGNWESFKAEGSRVNDRLHLQSNFEAQLQGQATFSTYPLQGNWEDLIRRQTYHLVVVLGAKLSVNEALTLHGCRGHKWVYETRGADGVDRLFYRLYLALPGELSAQRLLVLHATTEAQESFTAVPIFNQMARSLTLGLSE